MTKNQIEYWRNVETERHNREMEKQAALELEERKRAAMANESYQRSSVSETVRSNLARESENNRANLARESNDLLATQLHYAASTYSADQNVRAAGISASATKYAADTNEKASKYVADTNKSSTKYKTDVESGDRNRDIAVKSNSNPWVSIATTLKSVIPRVADIISTKIQYSKSVSPKKTVTVKTPVSTYNR